MKNKKTRVIIIFLAIITVFCGCSCEHRFSKHEKNQKSTEGATILSEEDIEWQKDEYNYLAIGNSITLSGIGSNWWNEIGMAASDEEHDYYHLVLKYLEENNDSVKGIPCNFGGWETHSHNRDEAFEYLDCYLSEELDLVTIQLGENVRDLTTYQEDYVSLIRHVKEKAPDARILVIDDFWSDGYRNELKKSAAAETDVEFVSLEGITNNKEYYCGLNTIVYDKDGGEHIVENGGVANHPGDKGMAAIASKIIEELKDEKE